MQFLCTGTREEFKNTLISTVKKKRRKKTSSKTVQDSSIPRIIKPVFTQSADQTFEKQIKVQQ